MTSALSDKKRDINNLYEGAIVDDYYDIDGAYFRILLKVLEKEEIE